MSSTTTAGGEYNRRLPFNTNILKLIAMVCMVCDHYSVAFISPELNTLRLIGRVSFPIFAFLIARGAEKTHDIISYLLRLLIFAFISEIPFDLMVYGKIIAWEDQNVYFTLASGLLCIAILQALQKKGGLWPLLSVLPLAAMTVVCELVHTDYATGGTLAIFLFYAAGQIKYSHSLRTLMLVAAVLAPCLYFSHISFKIIWNTNELGCLFSVPLLLLYNGERGRLQIPKYLFYAFYPAHLLLFGLIKVFFLSA